MNADPGRVDENVYPDDVDGIAAGLNTCSGNDETVTGHVGEIDVRRGSCRRGKRSVSETIVFVSLNGEFRRKGDGTDCIVDVTRVFVYSRKARRRQSCDVGLSEDDPVTGIRDAAGSRGFYFVKRGIRPVGDREPRNICVVR